MGVRVAWRVSWQDSRPARGRPQYNRIPRTENQLPRVHHEYDHAPPSMQKAEGPTIGRVYADVMELPGTTEAQSFLEAGCSGHLLMLKLRQKAQARLPTSRRAGVPLAEAMGMSDSIWRRVGISQYASGPHRPFGRPSEDRATCIRRITYQIGKSTGYPRNMPQEKRWPTSSVNIGWRGVLLAKSRTSPQDLRKLTCSRRTTQGPQIPQNRNNL